MVAWRVRQLLLLPGSSLIFGERQGDDLKGTGWNRYAAQLDRAIPDEGWQFKGAWQVHVVKHLISICTGKAAELNCGERDIYEFGVYTGRYMRMLSLVLARSGVDYRKFFGFDSFQGLPPEDLRSKPQRVHWQVGSYNAADIYKTYSSDELQAKIKTYINNSRVELVRGFYNESLTVRLVKSVRPALYVEIDCDLYISTVQALEWMLANRLIVRGTVIGYDDMKAGGAGGERQAHEEMVSKYGLKLRSLAPNIRPNNIFAVEGVGPAL